MIRVGMAQRAAWLVATSLVCAGLRGQALLTAPGGQVHVIGSDLAVLEAQEVRKEISCTVTPEKPSLGFDLRFHAGFNVTIPLKELAGNGNALTILFRVTPTDHPGEPSYFVERYTVPQIAEDAGGDASLEGNIDLGEGNYHIDWMMRDRTESVCSFYWDMEASLASKDRDMKLETPAGKVEAAHFEQFTDEAPVSRVLTPAPLAVKVLVNFAPQNSSSATLRPQDTSALVGILRRISREPQFGRFSVVAFNIQEQRVLYRQESADKIDFPALGDALQSIKLGTVDTKRLQQKHGDTEFLTELIQKEISSDDHPDALVFAGPKVMLEAAVPEDSLKPLNVDYPVFYMNYALNPQAVPWRDSISRAVRVFRGTEYTISKPRDLWFSVTEMVSRIVKLKLGRSSVLPSH